MTPRFRVAKIGLSEDRRNDSELTPKWLRDSAYQNIGCSEVRALAQEAQLWVVARPTYENTHFSEATLF